MLEKCEAALKSWPKWNKSLEIARARMETKYGNVANLIAGAKVECEVKDKGSSGKSSRLFVNNEQWTKWEIETELESAASDFVKREMGLRSDTEFHDIFVSIWVSSISPLFRRDIRIERETQHEIEYEGNPRLIQLESKVKDKKDDRIWNSISWYQDAVSHREVVVSHFAGDGTRRNQPAPLSTCHSWIEVSMLITES